MSALRRSRLELSSGPVKPEVIAASPFGSPRTDDAWLQRWLPLLREHTGDRCVLELGCGEGRDTAVLHVAGLRVVAIDRSLTALAEAREAVPGATFIESDLRAPLPIDAGQVGAIVASLSLHYFDWQTTCQVVEQLRVCLTPNRPLLCRVNSTRDDHHGSTGHPSIEPGYFRVGDTTKRFFDRADLLKLFADGWHIVALEEQTIDRYKHCRRSRASKSPHHLIQGELPPVRRNPYTTKTCLDEYKCEYIRVPTTIHIPEPLLNEVDERAKTLKLSRNRFIVDALRKALAEEPPWSPGFLDALRAFTPLDSEHDVAAIVRENRRSRKNPLF